MRKQVEPLEDHADLGAFPGQDAFGQGDKLGAARLADADAAAVDAHLSVVDRLEQGETAEQCALARSRRPQDRLHVAAVNAERHAAQHLGATVTLVQADRLEDIFGIRGRLGRDRFSKDGLVKQVSHGERIADRFGKCVVHRIGAS